MAGEILAKNKKKLAATIFFFKFYLVELRIRKCVH